MKIDQILICANGLKVLSIPNRVTGQNSFQLENKDDDFRVVTNALRMTLQILYYTLIIGFSGGSPPGICFNDETKTY